MESYDVAIIGAGPAGLTAGLYCARYGLKTAIIEKGLVGGTAVWASSIKNYPGFSETSGLELMMKFKEQAEAACAKIIEGTVLEIKGSDGKAALKEVVLQGDSLKAKAVIVAVGSKSRWLKVPGEKELLNKGVHFCATCDGPVYSGKDVAVIGSDGRALDEAIYLASVAKKVTLISPKKELDAEQAKIDLLKEKKIAVMKETSVVSFKGKDFLEEIIVKSNTGKQGTVFVSGAFIYVGTDPNTEFADVKKEKDGRILITQKMETSVKGIFAAGDCIKKELNQVATCVGEGAIAAHSAAKLVHGEAGNQWA